MKNISIYIPMLVTDHIVNFWVLTQTIRRNTQFPPSELQEMDPS